MSEYLIQGETLTNIANAIREKKESAEPILVSSFADEIASIETGGGGLPSQEKTVELALAGGDQVVLPDTDFSLSKVTIVKPETLKASNIKFGVSIAGVDGALVTGTNPQLHAPTIAKSANNVNITNPSTNGDFVSKFGCYNGGILFTEIEASPLDLQSIAHNKYSLTCRCSNTDIGFIDSEDSNTVELTVYAFSDCTNNVETTFDWLNNSNGIELSFKITANEGFYLPPSISILCNGEELDFEYNPYTGDVTMSALALAYSGTLADEGQLPVPVINGITDHIADITTGAGTQYFEVYNDADDTLIATVERADLPDDTTIEIGAFAVVEKGLVAPEISLSGDTLTLVDSYLKQGDVLYSETYEIYSDGNLVASGIDSTQEQNAVISYAPMTNFAKQSTGYYKSTNTGANTYGLLRVDIIAPKDTTIQVDFTAYTRSSYCYAYLGKIDVPFTDSYSTESSVYASYTSSTTTTNSYTQAVTAGSHSIYFKFYRRNTSSYSDRYLSVKVTEVTA